MSKKEEKKRDNGSLINIRELADKYQANNDRILEIADLCEKEERERTEAETIEFNELSKQNNIIEMRLRAAASRQLKENPETKTEVEKTIRENVRNGVKTEIIFVRDVMMVGDVAKGALVPLNVQEILEPLEEGFILDKVGLPLPTGLVGEFVWPLYEMVEAELLGEAVELSSTKIPFSKLTAAPERMGVAIPATHQSLNQSNGLLENIIRKIMPKAIQKLLNKIILSREPANSTTNLKGPFVEAAENAVELSEVPTFKELNMGMKAKVLETGIDGENLCWTMTKSMEAILEGTPINEKGVYIPMVQDHKLCGLPIYTSNLMRDADGTENIGLGDWRYQPMGLFNTLRFIVDPYSKARKDCVDFVLNADYATKTLRPEAFILGKVAKASAPVVGGEEPEEPEGGDEENK